MRTPPRAAPQYLVAAAYLGACTIAVCAVLAIWATHHSMFFNVGRDADYSLWIMHAYRAWARPFDVTALNPLQGMASMLVVVNPYLNPGAWVWATGLADSAKHILSQFVYFLEVTVSTFILGRALGFSRPLSFAASMWVTILLFSPFNGIFGLQGWIATAPSHGHALAFSNLILASLTRIGAAPDEPRPFLRALKINWAWATGVLALLLAILLAAPFYNAGMLIGSCVASFLIVLSSVSRPQVYWRIASGLYILACLYLLGLFDFYAGAGAYAARFAGESPGYVVVPDPALFLCQLGVVCNRQVGWPIALTGSHWLHVAAIAGGLAVFASMPKPLSRLGLLFAATWLALLSHWVLVTLGIRQAWKFSALYFYFMLYPLIALFSLYFFRFLYGRLLAPRLALKDGRATEVAVAGGVAAAWVALVFAFGASPSTIDAGFRQTQHRGSSPIVEWLKKEAVLRKGEKYRGAVATVLGAPHGSLRKAFGFSPDAPLSTSQRAAVLELAAQSGHSHDLLDLWWPGIPTLSEYAQGISPPLMRYITEFLILPGDEISVNYAVPSVVNAEVMRAMGVRFVITDASLSGEGITRILTIAAGNSASIQLYELQSPNLGTFSPTAIHKFEPGEFFRKVKDDPRLLETQAFGTSAVDRPLVPVRDARMAFERRGLHVTATSEGASSLLLPVQFSHCYLPIGPSSGKVTVMRANGLHTLVVFDRTLDLHLRWRYSFWQNQDCRRRDAAELKALGLL